MQLQYWRILSFLAEVARGSGKGVEFPILTEGTVPQGSSGTKNLNNLLNVNNLKILFNCFPSSAGLCRRGCTGKPVVNHHCTDHDWGGVGVGLLGSGGWLQALATPTSSF